jgi:hypothetical protein
VVAGGAVAVVGAVAVDVVGARGAASGVQLLPRGQHYRSQQGRRTQVRRQHGLSSRAVPRHQPHLTVSLSHHRQQHRQRWACNPARQRPAQRAAQNMITWRLRGAMERPSPQGVAEDSSTHQMYHLAPGLWPGLQG